jgi:hypothetical protein
MGHRIFSLFVPLSLAGIILGGVFLLGQESKVVRVDVESHGSPPPISAWYACVRKLDGQLTFNLAQGNKCLREILDHRKYFKSGRIEITPSKFDSELVVFVLESPPLKLTKIDYGIRNELQSEFRDYVTGNNLFPRVGDTYDSFYEGGNASLIGNFFESKGIMVGISKRIDLNYRAGTASLTYKMWEGPDGPVSPLLMDCEDEPRITYFSLLDLDDFTPRNLVLKSTYTRSGECFSESAIRSDEQVLKNLKIFSAVSYTEGDGNGSGRGVLVHVRTDPLMVSEVSVEAFGLASREGVQKESTELPELPLKASQRYRQSEAEVSRRMLERYFKTDTAHARVFEDDEVGPDHTLKVTYQLLSWPADELYIDGLRFE